MAVDCDGDVGRDDDDDVEDGIDDETSELETADGSDKDEAIVVAVELMGNSEEDVVVFVLKALLLGGEEWPAFNPTTMPITTAGTTRTSASADHSKILFLLARLRDSLFTSFENAGPSENV